MSIMNDLGDEVCEKRKIYTSDPVISQLEVLNTGNHYLYLAVHWCITGVFPVFLGIVRKSENKIGVLGIPAHVDPVGIYLEQLCRRHEWENSALYLQQYCYCVMEVALESVLTGLPPYDDVTGGLIWDELSIACDKVMIENIPAQTALDEAAANIQEELDKYYADK